jgi:hypothetical protein
MLVGVIEESSASSFSRASLKLTYRENMENQPYVSPLKRLAPFPTTVVITQPETLRMRWFRESAI